MPLRHHKQIAIGACYMSNPSLSTPSPSATYLLLIALLTSIGALATDIMLPALGELGTDLNVANMNNTTIVVTAFFLGMAFGQMVAGPMSDSWGRKPVVLGGYALFVVGAILSMTAESWNIMVLGRVLQGLGAAAPRVITMAIVRDEYQGRVMAKIMSFVMAVFVIVPVLAPMLGQVMIYVGGWRATFAALIVISGFTALWFHLSMHETLTPEKKRPFAFTPIIKSCWQIGHIRPTMLYMMAMGFISGPFIGYLGTARQIFQDIYNVGDAFVFYFAVGSIAFGAASLLNSRLVMRLGMRRLCNLALIVKTLLSGGMLGMMLLGGYDPSLTGTMVWMLACFFCLGMVFGNINALAMEPLGKMAGVGAAVVTAGATLISLPLGYIVNISFDGTITTLVAGFAVMGGIALLFTSFDRNNKSG